MGKRRKVNAIQHVLGHGDAQLRIKAQQRAGQHAEAGHDDGRREPAPQSAELAPQAEHQPQADDAHRRHQPLRLRQLQRQMGKGLQHRFGGHGRRTQQGRHLAHDDHDANRREHGLHHGGRQHGGVLPGAQGAEQQLQHAREHDGHQHQRVTQRQIAVPQQQHAPQQHRRERRRRAADGDVRAPEQRIQQARDDGRNQSGNGRGARGQRHPERERHPQQGHLQTGWRVMAPVPEPGKAAGGRGL
mmetsp:Transcript_38692/g.90455  ORF Transcript_38692/g.90455 Transcript_38692/m.90455 type:complete len:244 (+) Transcript_38692:2465-3196(+)